MFVYDISRMHLATTHSLPGFPLTYSLKEKRVYVHWNYILIYHSKPNPTPEIIMQMAEEITI